MEEHKFIGAILRMMRTERSWSQEQLCSGICAVSYLSKIEQGRVNPHPDLIEKLFLKLDIPPQYSFDQNLKTICDRLYEMVFSDDSAAIESCKSQGLLRQESMALNVHYLDYLVLRAYCCRDTSILPEDLRPFLMPKQQCLMHILSDEAEEAMRIYPCALTAERAGIQAYKNGNYSSAIQFLNQAYISAAADGYAKIMAYAKFYSGNCYLETRNVQNMKDCYTIAKRLATAIQDDRLIKTIDYNAASAAVEHGEYEEAYEYFSHLENPTVLDVHKLAICCEKTGKRVEALAMLASLQDKAAGIQKDMCDLVRYRLKNKDYLEHPEYGKLLMRTFQSIRATMPLGFARFHLPWIEEWCVANRQYKVIYEILKSFP